MLLQYFYDEQLAQASYMVGCAASGEALVVDPMRNSAPYLQAAAREGLRVAHIVETHIHADFVSGSRELAAATGATLYISAAGGEHWHYAFAAEPGVQQVRDGHCWMVGSVRVEVRHTPGHTPEHIALLVTDTAAADQPMGLFSGDFLFVGDVGRPDLLEAAAGLAGSREPAARQQWQAVQAAKTLPAHLQVWPGHGAGSACGKALGAIPSTTMGYEQLFNPAFQQPDEASFVAWLLAGQPEAPRYFARMKQVNQAGPPLLRELQQPQQLNQAAIDNALAAGELVVDLRSQDAFVTGHLPGTLAIAATSKQWITYVGWFVDYSKPLWLIVPEDADLERLLVGLRAIGVDQLAGYLVAPLLDGGTVPLPTVDAEQLRELVQRGEALVLDVRGQGEYDERHIVGARHVPLGFLPQHLHELPRDQQIVTQCASGYRAQIAASLLRKSGFCQVATLADKQGHWRELLPTATNSR